jgi:uncharacterized membrane protein YoaK (UPF0700 family)
MSGTSTIFSTSLSRGALADARHAGLVLLSFFLGCVLSGMIIRRHVLQIGPRYSIALGLETILLLAATHCLQQGVYLGDCFAAAACGLQNAMTTTYSGAVIRTTHVTGIVTDLGLALGHFLRRETVAPRQITIHLVLIVGFLFGGVMGGLGYRHWGANALLFPALLTGLTGISYSIYCRWHRESGPD